MKTRLSLFLRQLCLLACLCIFLLSGCSFLADPIGAEETVEEDGSQDQADNNAADPDADELEMDADADPTDTADDLPEAPPEDLADLPPDPDVDADTEDMSVDLVDERDLSDEPEVDADIAPDLPQEDTEDTTPDTDVPDLIEDTEDVDDVSEEDPDDAENAHDQDLPETDAPDTDIGGDAPETDLPPTLCTFYEDRDGDRHGAGEPLQLPCDTEEGYVLDHIDCDDTNGEIYPGALEVCNRIDDNCIDGIDEGLTFIAYLDLDEDGVGDTETTVCSLDEPFVSARNGDCDDTNEEIFPGHAEVCGDTLDNDCDPTTLDNTGSLWYVDNDGDGFGEDGTNPFRDCLEPPRSAPIAGDCDDTNDDIYPGAAELCDERDNDCSGEVDDLPELGRACVADALGICANGLFACAFEGLECVPAASQLEVCGDELDSDCDGELDNGFIVSIWADTDGDGFGGDRTVAVNHLSCLPAPEGFALNRDDCDDALGNVFPGATELCDGLDNDCNEQTDESFPEMGAACAVPDALGPCAAGTRVCEDGELRCVGPDPADEVCNAIDDDCDGGPDNGLPTQLWYVDTDGDSYGTGDPVMSCLVEVEGYSRLNGDCAPDDPLVHPFAFEICGNAIDDNCVDGTMDEGQTVTYPDLDEDGFGDPLNGVMGCVPPEGYVLNNTDCNDTDPLVHPGAIEAGTVWNEEGTAPSFIDRCADTFDNDCNGQADAADVVCGDRDMDGIVNGVDWVEGRDLRTPVGKETLCVSSDAFPPPWNRANLAFFASPIGDQLLGSETIVASRVYEEANGGWCFSLQGKSSTSTSGVLARFLSSLSADGESALQTTTWCADPEAPVIIDFGPWCDAFQDPLCEANQVTTYCAPGPDGVGTTVLRVRWDGTNIRPGQ